MTIGQMSHRTFRISGRMLPAFAIVLALCAGSAASAQDMPKTPQQALALEKADYLPGGDFYQTRDPLLSGKPGALIRSEPTSGYTLPKGAHAVRILYHSRSATGKDVAASGVVLTPAGSPPPGGWPVVAWAHGTSGVARICAPSLMKDVYYGDEGLYPMLRAGLAIIATDYAGLGTAGPHQYLDRTAQANDVINSIRAAHAAVPGLSKKWVVDGHSQGGGAAWGVAEQEARIKDPDYLGAVVVAGYINPRYVLVNTQYSRQAVFYLVYAAYGIKARFPQFDVADMLSGKALARYRAMTSRGCWYYGATLASQGELGSAVKPGWQKNKWVRAFIEENRTLQVPVTGPLLVLAGGADHSIPLKSVQEIVGKACKLNYTIDFHSYPGLDHDPVMDKSTPDQIRWIRDRFDGKPAASNCKAR